MADKYHCKRLNLINNLFIWDIPDLLQLWRKTRHQNYAQECADCQEEIVVSCINDLFTDILSITLKKINGAHDRLLISSNVHFLIHSLWQGINMPHIVLTGVFRRGPSCYFAVKWQGQGMKHLLLISQKWGGGTFLVPLYTGFF